MSEVEKTELESLKERATLMGIKFHPNSKEDSLRSKIQAVLDGQDAADVADEDDDFEEDAPAAQNSSMPELTAPLTKSKPGALQGLKKFVGETKEQRQARLKLEGIKLVRCRIHCNNPMKSEWQGEQFTISNRNIGTVNRFVPFDEDWHVEACIIEMMRDRQYLSFSTKKRGPMQLEVKEPKYVREFNIEILEPLTQKQLRDLAVKQALQGGDTDAAREED